MRYQVLWLPGAESELERLWLDEPLRNHVTLAANEIDRLLQLDPENEGESRERGIRILFVTPLVITFRIDKDNRTVYVREVWPYGNVF